MSVDTAPLGRGGSPTLVRDELRHVIATHAANAERSQQTRIGPSEIGTPCDRRLGFKLASIEPVNIRAEQWRPTVGTAVHAWLAGALAADNARMAPPPMNASERWVIESVVDVGDIDGQMITGHADAYDAITATVIDWKIVGPTSLRSHKANGAGAQYATQVQLYGRGIARVGLHVDTVAVYFLPSNGELSDGFFWYADYDESIAVDALERATRIASAIRLVGAELVIPQLERRESYCLYCPWYQPGARDLAGACPGVDKPATRSLFDELLPQKGNTGK